MNKKIVVLGGGTGMSTLLKGLKEFPLDITAVVTVCDDGKSTGRLRKEFNTIAVGDIRRVFIALSETEPIVEKLFNYRFKTTSDLNGHTVGNILLTAMSNITGNMAEGLQSLGNVLKLKGKVLPLTEENVILMGKMEDASIIEGEHNITESPKKIIDVYYKKEPKVLPSVLEAIKEADLIVLSMGSIFTSILPNLICKEIIDAIDKSIGKVIYVCNMMTQPGETDNYKVSDHINLLNNHLGNKKIDAVIVNNGKIDKNIIDNYSTLEQKDLVENDFNNINCEVIKDNFVLIDDHVIRHNSLKLALSIFSYSFRKE